MREAVIPGPQLSTPSVGSIGRLGLGAECASSSTLYRYLTPDSERHTGTPKLAPPEDLNEEE